MISKRRFLVCLLSPVAFLGIAACSGLSESSSLSDGELCSQAGEFLADGWNVRNSVAGVAEQTESDNGEVGSSVLCEFSGDDDFRGTLLLLLSDAEPVIAGASEDVHVGDSVVRVVNRDSYQVRFVLKWGGWTGDMTLLSTEPSRTQPKADPATDAQVNAAARALVDAVKTVAG